jgi:hypothetical protein
METVARSKVSGQLFFPRLARDSDGEEPLLLIESSVVYLVLHAAG